MLGAFTGKGARCTSSGTTALSIAIRWAIERTGTKRVAVPAFTFLAVPQAVLIAGGEIDWYDVNPSTLLPQWSSLNLSDERPLAAIVVCLLYGFSYAEFPAALRAANTRCRVLVDSAHFLGASDDQKNVFSVGDAHALSFSAAKIVGGAEGGAVIGSDDLLQFCELARNYGGSKGIAYNWGVNGKLSELNALAASDALERVRESRLQRVKLATQYAEFLSGLECIDLLRKQYGDLPLKEFPFLLSADKATYRNEIVRLLQADGIEARTYFSPPLFEHPAYAGAIQGIEWPGAVELASRVICLPLSERMNSSDVDFVCERLMSIVTEK
jgi:dTDP-4-amino-4,6-dideoxygalactose transaminase